MQKSTGTIIYIPENLNIKTGKDIDLNRECYWVLRREIEELDYIIKFIEENNIICDK